MMRKVTKLLFVFSLLLLAAIGSAVAANAMGDHGGGGRPGGPGDRRLSGVVAAVTADSITITKTHHLAPSTAITDTAPITDGRPGSHHPRLSDHHPITDTKGLTATIKVSSMTVIYLLECQCTGSLSDVTLGRQIHIDGNRNSDGTTTAITVTVAPAGDQLGGAVTAVDGATLTLQARHGSTATLVTTSDTQFFTQAGAATLADIGVGRKVMAFGAKQSDGALVARVVLIRGTTATPDTNGTTTGTATAVDELVDVLAEDMAADSTAVVAQLFLPLVKR